MDRPPKDIKPDNTMQIVLRSQVDFDKETQPFVNSTIPFMIESNMFEPNNFLLKTKIKW